MGQLASVVASPDRVPQRLFFVYEAVNAQRREIVVGISGAEGLEAVQEAHKAAPPRRFRRWDPGDEVHYRVVESSLPISQALEFCARYTECDALDLFRVYLSADSMVA
jgi:hypothetical protein